jgi:hypothetical protein
MQSKGYVTRNILIILNMDVLFAPWISSGQGLDFSVLGFRGEGLASRAGAGML